MTTEPTTPQALLNRAADILDERGWHQGDFADSDDRCVCLIGAINLAYAEAEGLPLLATGDHIGYDDYNEAYGDAIVRVYAATGEAFATAWNDAPGRTKDEVQEMLRRAAGGVR